MRDDDPSMTVFVYLLFLIRASPFFVRSLLVQMSARIHSLLDHEMSSCGIPSHRIILGGFGEGACMALHAGLSYRHQLGGIVSIAGYLPLPQRYPQHLTRHGASNAKTPILVVHGNSDTSVPLAFAKQRYAVLAKCGVKVEMRTEWKMEHFMRSIRKGRGREWRRDEYAANARTFMSINDT